MTTTTDQTDFVSAATRRGEELYETQRQDIIQRTDRFFAVLMPLQWLAGIAAALWISPRTWAGAQSSIHVHVWAAVFLGGAISSLPLAMIWLQPGKALTRHVIAIAQMLTSALLIHLTGGRIETHFHVFGSLAILACYRDWRVLLSATVVVAVDHLVRGLYWPQSVFGVLTASPWRWLEHAGWVVFEDIFLIISIRQSLAEMRLIAERQANLEDVNHRLKQRARELESEIRERKQAELQLEQNQKFAEASRLAGRAEVATGVLHNVGNVLNSVNVSATLVQEQMAVSKLLLLRQAADLLAQHLDDAPAFITSDPKGRVLPSVLVKLTASVATEQGRWHEEMKNLRKNIEHMREIVAMQQAYARVGGVTELLSPEELVHDALQINSAGLERHGVQIRRFFEDVPQVKVDRHKVMQILINLISNAKYALDASNANSKELSIHIARNGGGSVKIIVEDNGVGIPPENLNKIFGHGFTTKREGHGFGLHSGALAAQEMGGQLTAASEGPGCGARFILELPAVKSEPKPQLQPA
jgi:signal transduction histidine kinase